MNISVSNLLKDLTIKLNNNCFEEVYSIGQTLIKDHNNNPFFLKLLGVACLKLNKIDESVNYLSESIKIKKDDFEAYLNLGAAFINQSKYSEAIKSLTISIDLNPTYEMTYNNIGIAYSKLEKNEEALSFFLKAININQNYLDALYNIGLIYFVQNKFEESKFYFNKIIKQNKNFLEVNFYYALCLRKLKKFDESINAFIKTIQHNSNNELYYYNIGQVYQDAGRYKEAIDSFKKTLKINSKYKEALNGLGVSLTSLDKIEEAIFNLKKAIILDPNYKLAYINIGIALRKLCKINDAIEYYNKVIKIDTNYAKANFGKGVCLLQLGKYKEGWKYYKWRFEGIYLKEDSNKVFSKPRLTNLKNISGKKILVIHEQGLGDTIHFGRYTKLLLDKGAYVIFKVQEPLVKLMKSLDEKINIISKNDFSISYDYYCFLLDLPKIFNTDLNSIPTYNSYLSIDAAYTSKWENFIRKNKFNVGISWQGSKGDIDKGRSLPLIMFKNIANIKSINLISLQKNDGVEQIEEAKKIFPLINFGNKLDKKGNFMDTAVIMKNLDLIITVDTSIAHLAGSLGCKVWIILQYSPDWRWMLNTKYSKWYPSMRIFRQKKLNNWHGVFKEIEEELKLIN